MADDPVATAVVVLLVASAAVYGMEVVLLVLAADRRLGLGSSGVGWPHAAVAAGDVLALPLAARAARGGRTETSLVGAGALLGLPVVVVAALRAPLAAAAVLAVEGAANAVLDVVGLTTLQQRLRPAVLARVAAAGTGGALAIAGSLLLGAAGATGAATHRRRGVRSLMSPRPAPAGVSTGGR